MDTFEKSLKIWEKIDDPLYFSFERRFIFDNEYVGKENNCLLSVPNSVILLDGDLNELHIFKNNKHQTILMTPHPFEKFSKIELSSSKLFVALIGKDSVSLVDIFNVSSVKTCKKVKEIFSSRDEIVAVKWYPEIYDFIFILTKQSINIFRVNSNLSVSKYYEYQSSDDIDSSKSFGIKEEFVSFDFGRLNLSSSDHNVFILKDSGEIFYLPELRKLRSKDKCASPVQLFFDPPSKDNYQDDFKSMIVLRGLINVLVLANAQGTIQHACFVTDKICVYDTINVPVSSDSANQSGIFLISDETAYPPRYFICHSLGIQSCILPWVVRMRSVLKSNSESELESCINNAGNSIFDWVLRTDMVTDNKTNSHVRFAGLTVVRGPAVAPELFIMQCRDSKDLMRIKLRQESSLMLSEELTNIDPISADISLVCSDLKQSKSKFLETFLSELKHAQRFPILSSNSIGKEPEDTDKIRLVLQMNEMAGDYGKCVNSAGIRFQLRLKQMVSVVAKQEDQLITIRERVCDLKQKAEELNNRWIRASSRQKNILNRLSTCSYKLAEINGVSNTNDKGAINTIRDIMKYIKTGQTALRSCKLRYEQLEKYPKDSSRTTQSIEFPEPYFENLKEYLKQEDSEITQLVTDVQSLMKIDL